MFIKEFQNKGYCCELLKTVIDYCFTQMSISSLFSFTLNSNKPVAHILHKLDFEKLAVSPLEPPSPDGSYWAIYNT